MGKHTYLNGKSETPHVWTRHSRRPESRGCGRLSARSALSEVTSRDEAAWSGEVAATAQRCGFTDTGCSGRLQASVLTHGVGPLWFEGPVQGHSSKTPPGPGLVTINVMSRICTQSNLDTGAVRSYVCCFALGLDLPANR